ncbi:MAG TPA: cold shock domain-containing protein [Paracoccaceae bacterium]|nr:cold shock domain-containing protein [Paracoccaceae bacterium]
MDRVEKITDLTDETAVKIVEISGFVKWFDMARGYGFIIPENGLPDVLIHLSCLKRDGYDTVLEGTRIVCEAVQRPKGLQALKVLSVDSSTAIQPAERPPARTHSTVRAAGDWVETRVKWFNRQRGYGFLTQGEGTPDIFIHMETLRKYAIAELKADQVVEVRFGEGPKGMMAAEIRIAGQEGGPQRPH